MANQTFYVIGHNRLATEAIEFVIVNDHAPECRLYISCTWPVAIARPAARTILVA